MEGEEGWVEAETIAGLAWGEGEGLGLGHFELLGLRVELVGLGLVEGWPLGLLAVRPFREGREALGVRKEGGGGGRVEDG